MSDFAAAADAEDPDAVGSGHHLDRCLQVFWLDEGGGGFDGVA